MIKENTRYSAKGEVSNVYVRRSFYEKAIINLKKAPITAWIGMIIVLFYFFVAVFAGKTRLIDTIELNRK